MNKTKYLNRIHFVILAFLMFESAFCQTFEMKGYVSNDQKEPLASANIVAKDQQNINESVFSVTDEKGFYKILLKKNHIYSVTISYLGYSSLTTNIELNANLSKNFILETSSNALEPVEIVIEKPIVQKGDTTTVNVAHFLKGSEQKLQDIIVNVPGFEITKEGSMFFNGKPIKNLMVEGKPFFDGSTKLGVQNIPSDAVEKIEVVENYNSVSFLKNFSDEDQTIINIKLKENKKKFWFGDIATGVGIPKNYKLGNNLFYYSPTLAINSISNVNNIGDKVFTIKDYLNFQGGVNAIFNDRFDYNDENFLNFTENNDFIKRNQIFNATHFSSQVSAKSLFSSYFIVNNIVDTNEEETNNYYENFSENLFNSIKNNQLMLLGKINYDYTIKDSKYWRFQTQLKKSFDTIPQSV